MPSTCGGSRSRRVTFEDWQRWGLGPELRRSIPTPVRTREENGSVHGDGASRASTGSLSALCARGNHGRNGRTEAKFLLLKHAFETPCSIRVGLKTDSRAAIAANWGAGRRHLPESHDHRG